MTAFKVDVGFTGEGYSRRIVEVEADSRERAIQKALAWYFGELTATIVDEPPADHGRCTCPDDMDGCPLHGGSGPSRWPS